MVNPDKHAAIQLSIPMRLSGSVSFSLIPIKADRGSHTRSKLAFWIWLGLLCVISANAAPLQWEQRAGYRAAPLNVPAGGKTGFTLLTPEQTNIGFTNNISYAKSQLNQNLLNGAGVAAGDFDGDGLCDLYFCNLDGSAL